MKKILFALLILLAANQANATYDQQFLLSQDSVFQHQVLVAEIQTCLTVLAEATTVGGHLSRANFAAIVIKDPQKWSPIIALVIASQTNNPMTPLTTPSTVSDALIQTAMNVQWSNMSGYFTQ